MSGSYLIDETDWLGWSTNINTPSRQRYARSRCGEQSRLNRTTQYYNWSTTSGINNSVNRSKEGVNTMDEGEVQFPGQ